MAYNMNDDNECPICFHEMLFPKQVDCCKRRFHEDCLKKWYAKSPTCPCCRSNAKQSIPILPINLLINRYNMNRDMIDRYIGMPVPRNIENDVEIAAIYNKYKELSRIEFTQQKRNQMFHELAVLKLKRSAVVIPEGEVPVVREPVARQLVVEDAPKKKRGRPLGSKNKPKDNNVEQIKPSKNNKVSREEIMAILNNKRQEDLNKEIKEAEEIREAIKESEANQARVQKEENERIAKEADEIREAIKESEANQARVQKEIEEEQERILQKKKEMEANPIKMAGNAALKRAIINILEKGGYK
jgi:hypothetical protein